MTQDVHGIVLQCGIISKSVADYFVKGIRFCRLSVKRACIVAVLRSAAVFKNSENMRGYKFQSA